MNILLEGSARPLLIAHAILGFAAVFAATHHAVSALLVAAGWPGRGQLRRFGWIAPAAFVSQALFGLALYPAYRVRVCFADFEHSAPRLAQLFDLKEHCAALALALVVAASFAGRALPRQAPMGEARAVAALSACGAALTWVAAVIGLYVTARHPVGLP